MTHEQKLVAGGALLGAFGTATGVWVLSLCIPGAVIMDTTANRLAFALDVSLLALVPLVISTSTVALRRSYAGILDPAQDGENRTLAVDVRVAGNTTEHTFVFFIALLSLSLVLPFTHLHVLWACGIWFVFARACFWVGYRAHPLLRIPGMSATYLLSIGMLGYAVMQRFLA